MRGFGAYLTKTHAQCLHPDEIPPGSVCTRAEEVQHFTLFCFFFFRCNCEIRAFLLQGGPMLGA